MSPNNRDLVRRFELLRKLNIQRERHLSSARRKIIEETNSFADRRNECQRRKTKLSDYASSSFEQLGNDPLGRLAPNGQMLKLVFEFAGASLIVSSHLDREIVQLDRDMLTLASEAEQLHAQQVKCGRRGDIIDRRQHALRRESINRKLAVEELAIEEQFASKLSQRRMANHHEVSHDR